MLINRRNDVLTSTIDPYSLSDGRAGEGEQKRAGRTFDIRPR
jgi:hypothetical protein